MPFTDSLEASRAQARAALRLMERHGIPPDPANYALWYGRQGGSAPAEDDSSVELSALIQEIRRETRRVAERSKDLEQWLARTGRELTRRRDRTEDRLRGAVTDSLTGLANRSCFEARLGEEVAGLWRSGGALSLVIADIDRFREFNVRYGRPMGRETLFAMGGAFKDMAARRDVAARYDGDTFAILRPGAALDQAMALGEDLRQRLASCKLMNLETGEDYGTLTVSVGVALYRLGEPTGAFVRRAELALRQAKTQGRNRVSAEDLTAIV
jgi:diguanylate cyclase